MDLLNRFTEFVKEQALFIPGNRLLLAVSGGVDSVVLCDLCSKAGYDFIIAHCNFNLRGIESKRDEDFVQSLGVRYGVEVRIQSFDTHDYMVQHKVSTQLAARVLRYAWFEELMQQYRDKGAAIHYLLTAHHADDNIETVLMNFFKGTGIAGLRGILPKNGDTVRPLLFAAKKALLDHAQLNGLPYVEDSSNYTDDYTRNYFRHQVIPLVETIYPEAIQNLTDNLHRFREVEALYYQSIHIHKKKLLEYRGEEIHIPVLKLGQSSPLDTIIYEIIKDYGFTSAQVKEVRQLLNSETGKLVSSASYRIIRNRKWLIIAPNKVAGNKTVVVEAEDKQIDFEQGSLSIAAVTYRAGDLLVQEHSIALLDAGLIQFPLVLRPWKQGDYFYPLGMPKKKKINRFLSDQKLSVVAKEKVWVVEMDKKIIWVIGLRIDDRFKVKPGTDQLLRITWQNAAL
jgi:tRNA(Ile)-lysidine synthase